MTTAIPTVTSTRVTGRTVQASVPIAAMFIQTGALAWRALVKMRRNPEQLLDVTLMPLLLTALFGYMFGGAVAGGLANYLPILIPGIIAYSATSACVAAGAQLREDMSSGVFDRLRSLPIARIAPLAGPMLADLARYALAATLTVTMGIVMGYRPGGGVLGVLGGLLLAVITGWSLAWIFMWIGTLARSAQAVSGVSITIMMPLTFLSNAFVPVNTLPGWLQAIVKVNPVTHIISALRDLMNDRAVTAQVGWALLGCAVVVAVFAPLAARSYSKKV
jgi:ABC-2 type transport system permease protein